MKKVSARWVPRLLTSDQKRMRMQASQEFLDHFQKNTKDFIRRFVTTDETLVPLLHSRTPLLHSRYPKQSKQWIHIRRLKEW